MEKTYPQPVQRNDSPLWDMIKAFLETNQLSAWNVHLLPAISLLTQSPGVILFISDPNISDHFFSQHGCSSQSAREIEIRCEQETLQARESGKNPESPLLLEQVNDHALTLFTIKNGQEGMAFLGLSGEIDGQSNPTIERLLIILGIWIENLAAQHKIDRQLTQLNTYLTVSSMMSQSQGLHESLEIALYCCMEVVQAETASVLLLDDDRQYFRFYHVEGPSKPVLETAIFPADEGLAGAVLKNRQSELVADVQNDPRFYGQIDQESGFQTRNMIVIPLVAGEEPIGVLEVLNKCDGGTFTQEEHLILLSIAEEIAFAIRNARIFEYVASSYCKQRQGLGSCRGCERPLGSWTPCVRYREAEL